MLHPPPSRVDTTFLLELGPGPTEVKGETVTVYLEKGEREGMVAWRWEGGRWEGGKDEPEGSQCL